MVFGRVYFSALVRPPLVVKDGSVLGTYLWWVPRFYLLLEPTGVPTRETYDGTYVGSSKGGSVLGTYLMVGA